MEVRYYTRAYVRVGELVFRHYFKVLEILPDVVLELPWLRGYNPTVNWKERYADIHHGSNLYRLSFGESRHSTQLQSQAASKLLAHAKCTLFCAPNAQKRTGSQQGKENIFLDV